MSTEKVRVEFEIKTGAAEKLMEMLKSIDGNDGFDSVTKGYRADDSVQRRAALAKFTDLMELKLRKNDHKKTWREKPIQALMRLLDLEHEELKVAVEFFTVIEAQDECIDIANYAMIVHDRLGMLPDRENETIAYQLLKGAKKGADDKTG